MEKHFAIIDALNEVADAAGAKGDAQIASIIRECRNHFSALPYKFGEAIFDEIADAAKAVRS